MEQKHRNKSNKPKTVKTIWNRKGGPGSLSERGLQSTPEALSLMLNGANKSNTKTRVRIVISAPALYTSVCRSLGQPTPWLLCTAGLMCLPWSSLTKLTGLETKDWC